MSRKLFYLAALLLAVLILSLCMLQYLQDMLYHRMMNIPAATNWPRYEQLGELRLQLSSLGPYMAIGAVLLGLTAALEDHGMLRQGRRLLVGMMIGHLSLIAILYGVSSMHIDLAELLIVFIDCWSTAALVGLPIFGICRLTKNL